MPCPVYISTCANGKFTNNLAWPSAVANCKKRERFEIWKVLRAVKDQVWGSPTSVCCKPKQNTMRHRGKHGQVSSSSAQWNATDIFCCPPHLLSLSLFHPFFLGFFTCKKFVGILCAHNYVASQRQPGARAGAEVTQKCCQQAVNSSELEPPHPCLALCTSSGTENKFSHYGMLFSTKMVNINNGIFFRFVILLGLLLCYFVFILIFLYFFVSFCIC